MRLIPAISIALLLAACGDDGTEADRQYFGGQCIADDDCYQEGAFPQSCLMQFKGGYCGLDDCLSDADCPEASACVAHSDGRNYCFRVCIDKVECNRNRDLENEANCSANIVFTDGANGRKACVPPSSGLLMRDSSWLPWQRGAFFCVGYAPMSALCLALVGLLPLHLGAASLVLPAMLVGMWLGRRERPWGRLALAGFAAGTLATGAYDVLRLGLVWLGVWGDFIPQSGQMVLRDDHAHPIWGYLWRFFGNGGGMGLAFAVLPWRGPIAGVIYGSLICGCLFLTILVSPDAAQRLFTLSSSTVAAALAGHWIYGAVLGGLTASWLQRDATGGDLGARRSIGLEAARIHGNNAP